MRTVEKAERERDRRLQRSTARTPQTQLRQAEAALAALPDLDAAIVNAKAKLRDKASELADARRALLPDDALEIEVGADDHSHDDYRYPVTCRAASGGRVSLGGCVNLGDANRAAGVVPE